MARRARVGVWAVAIGAAMVIASGFLPWFELRRRYRGFTIARLAVALGDYEFGVPAWTGVAWYALPLLAAINWVLLFHRGEAMVRRTHLWCAGLLFAGSVAYLVAAARYSRVLSGELTAVAGSATMLAGAIAAIGSRPLTNRSIPPHDL